MSDQPLPTPNPALDDKWLRHATWWVTYRPLLRRAALGGVIVVEAILLVYSGYGWLSAFVLNQSEDQRFYRELTSVQDVTALHQALGPVPLTVNAIVALPGSGSGGAYDVLAKVANKNKEWAAIIEYTFGTATGATPEQAAVLNNEERFFIGAGRASERDAAPPFTITSISWQRIRDLDHFNVLKPKFVVSDATFTPTSGSVVAGKPAPSQVRFTVTNEGVASYWSVGFTIILMNGDQPVAARYTTLDQVASGDHRDVSLNLYTSLGSVGTVLVVPDVNVLDPNVFMSVAGRSISF